MLENFKSDMKKKINCTILKNISFFLPSYPVPDSHFRHSLIFYEETENTYF